MVLHGGGGRHIYFLSYEEYNIFYKVCHHHVESWIEEIRITRKLMMRSSPGRRHWTRFVHSSDRVRQGFHCIVRSSIHRFTVQNLVVDQ